MDNRYVRMSKRILVTGGAGFLGSHLCEYLLSEGHNVICLDNLSSGRSENISSLKHNSSFKYIRRDVQMPGPLPSVDRIYHLASRASPSDFTEHPIQIALTNTQGTRLILEHARACDAKVVFASTSEIYGDPDVHPQPEEYTGNVNIRGPRGCYDEAKRFAEALTVAYKSKFGVDVRTVRIFNTYGPRMREDDGRVVPTFISQAISGNDLTIHGDGTQTRSFCYVDDLIRGLVLLMRANDPKYDVMNLGATDEVTIEELANLILNIVDTSSGITYEPLPEDDPSQRQPNITRAKEELNWTPKIGLSDGLKKTIKYYNKNNKL